MSRKKLDVKRCLPHSKSHHPDGDFCNNADGLVLSDPAGPRYTWANVGLFRRHLLDTVQPSTQLRPGSLPTSFYIALLV